MERNVAVGTIWHWQTESFSFQKQNYRGGIGKLEYRVLDGSNADNVAQMHRLLAMAFYTGIGYKTTLGLGQVQVWIP